jgi:hypothetical protein
MSFRQSRRILGGSVVGRFGDRDASGSARIGLIGGLASGGSLRVWVCFVGRRRWVCFVARSGGDAGAVKVAIAEDDAWKATKFLARRGH